MCNMLYATIYCVEMLRAFGQALTPTVRFVYAWFECDRSIIKTILLYLETRETGASFILFYPVDQATMGLPEPGRIRG